MSKSFNLAEEFTKLVENYGAETLYSSLKFVQHCGLYHSNITLRSSEKEEFFHAQEIIDLLEKLAIEERKGT